MEEKIRLNKYLAAAGICSRREADTLIRDGRVMLDGRTAVLGDTVSPESSVLVDGKPVGGKKEQVILLFHKPKGVLCTTRDPRAKGINVIDYIGYPERIFPVGRLDQDSEGLLLLTNDGDLSDAILRARNFHEKEYIVTVDRPVTEEFLTRMAAGVPILDTVTRPCRVFRTGKDTFHIILTQGLNRQIRRMCETLGYEVKRLVRIRIMNLELGDLPEGKWRPVTDKEKQILEKGLARDGSRKRE